MGPHHPLAPVPPRRELARGPASRAQSNGLLGDLTRSPKAIVQWLIRNSTTDAFGSLARPPSLYGATEGSANEAADVRLESFGLTRGLSAAAESAFPEGAIASILRDISGAEVHRLRSEALPPQGVFA